MPQKCYQAVFPAAGRCELQSRELPDPGAGEVLVRIEKSLLSPGTETAVFTGRHSVLQQENGWLSYPFLPGYSAAGRVQAVGAGTEGIRPGDRVFLVAPHATHAVVPVGKLTPLPDGLTLDRAVFAELGAIALNGVRLANVGFNDAVVVAGLGLVGLLATRLLKLSGALPLLAVELAASRREWGTNHGADRVLDPAHEDVAAAVAAATEGRGADIVVEATGVPRVVADCLAWPRRKGKVVLLGSPHGKVEVNFYDSVHARGLRLIGAHVGTAYHAATDADPWTAERNRRAFLTRVSRDDIRVEPLITRRITPDALEATYRSFAPPSAPNLGVIVDWTTTGGNVP